MVAIPNVLMKMKKTWGGGWLTEHSPRSGEKHFTSSQSRRHTGFQGRLCWLIYNLSGKEEASRVTEKLGDKESCNNGPKKTQIVLTHFWELTDHFKLVKK